MSKANERKAIIATQRREYLQFTSLHKPSSPFVTIITSKPQQQRNPFKSNQSPAFIYYTRRRLDSTATYLGTVIWAKQHGKFQASLSAWDFCVSGSCYLYYLSLREDTVLVHGMIWSETGLSKLILPRSKTIIKQQ